MTEIPATDLGTCGLPVSTHRNSTATCGMTTLAAALLSVHLLKGYEETVSSRYIAAVEGDGGLSLSKWEPYLMRHEIFDDLNVAENWIHAAMNDDWHAGTVLDTQPGIIVASAGMPLPDGKEGGRVARVVRDWWVGAYMWNDFGVHDSDDPE